MKNKWRILKILVTVIIFGFLLSFSLKKFNNASVKDLAVKMVSYKNPVYFIDEQDIKSIVKKMNPTLRIGDIEVPRIEREISKLDAVDSVNVYLNLNGVLNIDIIQKVPKFRLSSSAKSCYVDDRGNEFAISKKYSHPCMLVTGKVSKEEYPEVIHWINAIEADEFFKNYFIGIAKEKDDYYLLTSDGNFRVEIGDLENTDFKLKGFKVFVKKHLIFQDKDKYNKVSLKYNNQIVATLNKH